MVDLAGRALLPGFNDAHTHLELTSLGLGLAVSCHTPPHESVEDILTTIREHAASMPKGEWIIAQGSLFHDMRLQARSATLIGTTWTASASNIPYSSRPAITWWW